MTQPLFPVRPIFFQRVSSSLTEMELTDRKVELPIVSGMGFLWDPKFVEQVRNKYGVQGSSVGTLPDFCLQKISEGLPVCLIPEEVQFLVEKGWMLPVEGGHVAIECW